ncbi:MAG: MotA/TolQ/ExbB proton channel family protein, partial [bacterium]
SYTEKREAAGKAIEWHSTGLQKGLTTLATIGSISPFIGLFGTVLGIMRAFRDLAVYSGAGPSVVAVGIAEALICTAAGLFVAIPAIVAYNYFTHKSNIFIREMDRITEQAIDKAGFKEFADAG